MRLRRSDPHSPGIRRLDDDADGPRFVDPRGAEVTGDETIERISGLAIPPAWENVWICPNANGHIQASGTDAAGRRQYIYHPVWRRQRDIEKFERVLRFAAVLPRSRRVAARNLAVRGFPRSRALAAAFRLIDDSAMRIGVERYTRSAGTRGLTTLLCRHCVVEGEVIRLDFPAKGGQRWQSRLRDAPLARYLSDVQSERGARSRQLSWRDRRWHALTAAEVNDDIRERTIPEASAKDFRTLRGTLIAAQVLAKIGPQPTAKGRKEAMREATGQAAEALGNTAAVARSSYIDPRIFDAYLHGATLANEAGRPPELALVDLLS